MRCSFYSRDSVAASVSLNKINKTYAERDQDEMTTDGSAARRSVSLRIRLGRVAAMLVVKSRFQSIKAWTAGCSCDVQ